MFKRFSLWLHMERFWWLALVYANQRIYVKNQATKLGFRTIARFIDPLYEESGVSFCWHFWGWLHIYTIPLIGISFEMWFVLMTLKRLSQQKECLSKVHQALGTGDKAQVKRLLTEAGQADLAAQVDELI